MLLINELTKLNISINYSDPENNISGSIILDSEDWERIISVLNLKGYKIVRED